MEIDFFSETAEVTARPEMTETQSAEVAPEVTQEQTPQTVGRSIYGTNQPLGRLETFYFDPQCKNPIPPGALVHYTYDSYGNLVNFEKLASAQETPSETAETAQEAVEITEAGENTSGAEEGAETVGYLSEYYKQRMADAIANGDRIAYDIAKKNYGKALAKEQTKEFER